MMETMLNILIVVVLVFCVYATIIVTIDFYNDLMKSRKPKLATDNDQLVLTDAVEEKADTYDVPLVSTNSIDIIWKVHYSEDSKDKSEVLVEKLDDKPTFRVDTKY